MAIDNAATISKTTRSEIIVTLLSRLERMDCFDKLTHDNRKLLTQRLRGNNENTTVVDVRLPFMLINYYQLNGYNITQAIRLAVKLLLPPHDTPGDVTD